MVYKGIPNEHLVAAVPYYRAAGKNNSFLSRANPDLDLFVKLRILQKTQGITPNAPSKYCLSPEAWEYMIESYGPNEGD